MSSETPTACRLCGAAAPLQSSHVIPKFVFDWQKKGRGLRQMANPNRVIQDGPKPRLLCLQCEQRLSVWENRVAPALFRPLQDEGVQQFRYGPWLLPFAVSVSFRILTYWSECAEVGSPQSIRPWSGGDWQMVRGALDRWRAYLNASPGHTPEHHMFILPSGTAPLGSPMAPILAFISGAIDMQGPYRATDGGVYVIAKMCRLCSVGVIQRGRGKPWRNTKVHREGGALGTPYAVAPWVVEYLHAGVQATHAAVGRLSPKQSQRLFDEGRRALEALLPTS
jgi:hypothetical protein